MFESFKSKPTEPTNDNNAPPASTSHLGSSSGRHPFSNLRTCWPGLSLDAFSPFSAPTRTHFYRRIGILAILALSTLNSLMSIFSHNFNFSIIPRIILAVLHFLGSAWLLQCISRMVGERVVLNRTFTRRDFDFALGGFLIVELALVGWFWGGVHGHASASAWWGVSLWELVMLIAVGWLAWSGPLEVLGQAQTMVV